MRAPVRLGTTLALVLAASCSAGPAGVDANPDDLDGDGVPNAADNCERVRNADQHDEDGDAVGDACDNCPAIANANQADTTEQGVNIPPDGVGDACDPRSGASGDLLAAFFPWANAGESASWTGDGWTIDADALYANGTVCWQQTRPAPGDGLYVSAELASITWTSQTSELAITIDGDGVATGVTCAVRGDHTLHASEIGGASAMTPLPAALEPGTAVRLAAHRVVTGSTGMRVARLACRLGNTAVTIDLPDDLVIGTYAIATVDAAVAMSSLAVYTSPGPKYP